MAELIYLKAFCEYGSGHSSFGSASMAVLSNLYGDSQRVTVFCDSLPSVTRSFTSLDAIAKEAGQSRIFGGIHFQSGNQMAQKQGKDIANIVTRYCLAKL
jgi:hypothetical protein